MYRLMGNYFPNTKRIFEAVNVYILKMTLSFTFNLFHIISTFDTIFELHESRLSGKKVYILSHESLCS